MLRAGLVTWVLASFPLSLLIGGMIRMSTPYESGEAVPAGPGRSLPVEPLVSVSASRS